MPLFRNSIFIGSLFTICSAGLHAQTNQINPHLNGSATQNSCNCFTLTQAVNTQSGSVWHQNKIDLNQGFDFSFYVFLGCKDGDGADGIVFMLQPISTSVGTTGEGMGFEGVNPSIGISLDTWQNGNRNDPAYDHISIQANGNVTHGTDLAGPIQASSTNDNIEDCQWHVFRVVWDPANLKLSSYFDGVFRLEAQVNLVSSIFRNDPMVFWGFSAATGGANNLQQFCTSLKPDFRTNAINDATCVGTEVVFTDQSQSFSVVKNYYWDFGDGTFSPNKNPPPHLYTQPGEYDVKYIVTGFDDCMDTLSRLIHIGSIPVSAFEVFDTCYGSPMRTQDQSSNDYGNINQWTWYLDGSLTSSLRFPQPDLVGVPAGNHQLQLSVSSEFGCHSAPATQDVTIRPVPTIRIEGSNGCIREPITFFALQTDPSTQIVQWTWDLGNGQTSALQNPTSTYFTPGTRNITVVALADNGCPSATASLDVFVNEAVAFAGNDTVVIKDEPFQLHGTGGVTYQWSPAFGLDDPAVANPVGVLQDDITYTLTITTIEGCVASDDTHLTVFKGSAIYVPNGFTPNQDGLNELLKPRYIGIRTLYAFDVFNRWGQRIFHTNDLSKGWDGTWRGIPQPSNTYVWTLQAVDYIGKKYTLKGTVTIIR